MEDNDIKSILPKREHLDFKKIKVDGRTLDDVSLNIRTIYERVNRLKADKKRIVQCLGDKNIPSLRAISEFYYDTDSLYRHAVDFLATLFRFDYFVFPNIKEEEKKNLNKDKLLKDFFKILNILDESNIKDKLVRITTEVLKNGSYYGYIIPDNKNCIVLQDLPHKYCRSRYNYNARPAVEFNLKYFDENFSDFNYRMRVLKSMPEDFQKGYILWKKGKLPPDRAGAGIGWYLLDPEYAVKFNLDNTDIPYLVDAIPDILDLHEAQEVDKKKALQQLMKIIIQKLPIDKNGELVFDLDEARDLHSNACAMLKNTFGANVLTTFADIAVEDLSDSSAESRDENLRNSERTVFDSLGISQSIFNAEGNLSLDKSITHNVNIMRTLLIQYQWFLKLALKKIVSSKYNYEVKILETTSYNYLDLSKLYKEQIQYGYPKLYPQIALGHTQKELLSELYFEKEVLGINEILTPAASSNTMSGKDLNSSKNNPNAPKEEKQAGRKELPDDQKSDKTIKNIESSS